MVGNKAAEIWGVSGGLNSRIMGPGTDQGSLTMSFSATPAERIRDQNSN